MHGAVSLLPYMFSWRGASLPKGETLPFTLNAVSSRRKNVLFEAYYEIQKPKQSLRRSFAGCSYIAFSSGSNRPF